MAIKQIFLLVFLIFSVLACNIQDSDTVNSYKDENAVVENNHDDLIVEEDCNIGSVEDAIKDEVLEWKYNIDTKELSISHKAACYSPPAGQTIKIEMNYNAEIKQLHIQEKYVAQADESCFYDIFWKCFLELPNEGINVLLSSASYSDFDEAPYSEELKTIEIDFSVGSGVEILKESAECG